MFSRALERSSDVQPIFTESRQKLKKMCEGGKSSMFTIDAHLKSFPLENFSRKIFTREFSSARTWNEAESGKIYENVRLIMNDNNLTLNYVCIVNSPGKYLLKVMSLELKQLLSGSFLD